MNNKDLKVEYVSASLLKVADYNPRIHSKEQSDQLKESISRFGLVDPIICNSAPERHNIIIGGHFRVEVAKELGIDLIPVVYVHISDLEKEKELNIRLNKNTGDFDYDLLKNFDESFLKDIGFTSEELDNVFHSEEKDEEFNIEKELAKLDINSVEVKTGDVFEIDGSRLMVGDSTVTEHMNKLLDGHKADMCLTDPPYILEYLKEKNGKTDLEGGFGSKQNRRYIGTDMLPDNFTELWMSNIKAISKDHFQIIVYENWKNIRTIWNEMEKYWNVKNMIVWHVTNRSQGYPSKYKFFNKHDIAMVGTTENSVPLNLETEEEIFENEYQTALHAMSGKPQWENYEKGKKICPTDFIDHKAANAKSSEQSIIFGTKPLEILIPYIKVLTKRDDLIVEPFGGSGSTLIASVKMNRRCFIMEKSPIYAEVIRKRWENLTGKKAIKINENE